MKKEKRKRKRGRERKGGRGYLFLELLVSFHHILSPCPLASRRPPPALRPAPPPPPSLTRQCSSRSRPARPSSAPPPARPPPPPRGRCSRPARRCGASPPLFLSYVAQQLRRGRGPETRVAYSRGSVCRRVKGGDRGFGRIGTSARAGGGAIETSRGRESC